MLDRYTLFTPEQVRGEYLRTIPKLGFLGSEKRDLQLRNLSFKEAYTMKLKKKSVNIS
jgi:hypothetical protein